MKKKILVIVVAMLVLSMALTPFASAKPGAEKNNEEKFLSFDVLYNAGVYPIGWKYNPPKPKETQTVTYVFGEIPKLCEITIDDSLTYYLGTDFGYEGEITMKLNYNNPATPALVKIEYNYTFKSASGIDGTLEMMAVGTTWWDQDGQHYEITIRGQGTDDLEGVKVMGMGVDDNGDIVHEGIVTNWPMPPT